MKKEGWSRTLCELIHQQWHGMILLMLAKVSGICVPTSSWLIRQPVFWLPRNTDPQGSDFYNLSQSHTIPAHSSPVSIQVLMLYFLSSLNSLWVWGEVRIRPWQLRHQVGRNQWQREKPRHAQDVLGTEWEWLGYGSSLKRFKWVYWTMV